MADREGKPTANDIREAAKEVQRQSPDGEDSNKNFSRAGHQQRNDEQDSGGSLPKRDRSTK